MPRGAVLSPNDRRLRDNRLAVARAQTKQAETSNEVFVDDDTRDIGATANIQHTRTGGFYLYKLTPNGCVRIEVPSQSVSEILKQQHYSTRCFDCGSDECSGEMNGCPGRPPRKYRVCPVVSCKKRIYDSQTTGMRLVDAFDHSERDSGDENAISDETYSAATPESRTKAMLDAHIWGYHQAEASSFGVENPNWKKAVE